MNIVLTGASGFIGRRLIARLLRDGHSLHAIGRRRPGGPADMKFSRWDASGGLVPVEALQSADAIVNLAGEPIAQRWNAEARKRIRDSRVAGTRSLVTAIEGLRQRPQILVSASAIDYYGQRGEEILEEESASGSGFLPQLCVDWESEARAAGNLGLRVAMIRTGIVLGRDGGALKQMLPPFRLGVGGPLASGQQWMSWIHLDDLVEIIVFLLGRSDVYGPVNATSPNPVRNADFTKSLGRALGRPAILPVPKFALKLILGEVAEVAVGSKRVLPKVLQGAGFEFRYPEIGDALRNAI